MNDLMPFVIIGIATGSIYALAAVGLVLSFTTSGVFNFAHGAVAAVGAYAFYELRDTLGLPWPAALVLTLLVAAPAVGLVLERFGRRLASAPTTIRVVGAVGLLLTIQGVATARYGPSALPFSPFLPTSTFRLAGTQVGYDQVIVAIIALVAVGGLGAVLRVGRTGVAMRAVVDDPTLLALAGTSATRVRRTAWILGSAFAALSGVLIAPALGLDAGLLTLLVVQAFGAAAIGRFSNLTGTYLGALLIGVLASLGQRYVSEVPSLLGLPAALPFILLFVVLAVTPARHLRAYAPAVRSRARSAPLLARRGRRGAAIGAIAVALAAPMLLPSKIPVLTSWAGMAVVFASLGILVVTSGQISLCQASFAAVGATTFHHLAVGLALPWFLALVLTAAITGVVGALVALPAIRLSGIYLALATFGFGVLMQQMVYRLAVMFGAGGVRTVPRPWIPFFDATSDRAFYYVAVVVTVLSLAVAARLRGSRLGRLLQAIAQSPAALVAGGASADVTKLLAFATAAALAAVGGVIVAAGATATQSFSGYGPFDSLTWMTVLVICGAGLLRPAVLGAGLITFVPSVMPGGFAEHQLLIYGLGALALAMAVTAPRGIDARFAASAARCEGRRPLAPAFARFGDVGWRSPIAARSAAAAEARL